MGSAFSRSTGSRSGPTSSRRSPFSRRTRTSSTPICCATTCRRSCGSRNPGRSSSMSGIRAPSPAVSGPGLARECQTWNSSVPDCASSLAALESSVLNYPDYVVFDIDPYIYSGKEAPGAEPELNTVAFEKAKEVAFWLRELLQGMSLEPIVKTSGKTGLHVFVPIRRTLDFDAARQVSEIVGRHLMRRHPKDITLEWSVPKRTGKIFMDYNMNVRGKTLNVAYSPRGAPGAPVSMPLTWEELANAHPLDFRLANAAERLARTGDRWGDVLKRKQSLEKVLERAKP